MHQYECTGSLDDILQAILYQEQACNPDYYSCAGLPNQLNSLGIIYEKENSKILENCMIFKESIVYQHQAIHFTSVEDINLPHWLNILGTLYSQKFECTGNLDDIQTAILYQKTSY